MDAKRPSVVIEAGGRRMSLKRPSMDPTMDGKRGSLAVPNKGNSEKRGSLMFDINFEPVGGKGKSTIAGYIPGIMGVFFILASYRVMSSQDFFNFVNPKVIQSTYDYIVVGGGTSGSVLADRLSDKSDAMVLVVEAGDNPEKNPDIFVPILAENAWGTEFDWNYKTVPQKYSCKSHEGQSALWAIGKGMGGTSNLNYMAYLRGSRHDYDEWAQNGAHGWAYKDVLPYFIGSEDNHNGGFVNTVFHGHGGRLSVSDSDMSPVHKIIMKNAFEEVGVKKTDVNGRVQYGYSQLQATVRRGSRWGAYQGFLKRALARDNTHIIKNTQVQKIIFDGKKAIGVLIEYQGKPKILKAKKEVILAAGTVGSAKLLMLSGVGPRKHLDTLGIPVLVDLPVGDNLQDQVGSDGVEFLTPNYVSITVARADNLFTAWSYSLFGTGMKASPRARETIAFIRTRHQPSAVKYPLLSLQVVANVDNHKAEHVNVKYKTWEYLHSKDKNRNEGFTIFPTLLRPRSRGNIRLRSNNYEDPPLINPNYLQDEADVKLLVEGYQYARRLVKTTIMLDWEVELADKVLPECARHGNFTDAYVECFIRHITLSGHSPVGTCKMGAASDHTAVVDHNLKVRGLKNIRVVDASVFPNELSGNTYAAQVMLADKAADMIKGTDSVKAIKEYFKHMIAIKHDKFKDDDETHTTSTNNNVH